MPTGDRIVFSIEREHSRGPIEKERVETLNELRSHLARSAFVAARLGLQRARGATEALTAMGLPALLLGLDGTVIEANPLIEELPSHVQWRARNRIALTDGRANELLWAALAARDSNRKLSVRSFPLRDADDRAALVLHIIPVRRSAHDIFAGSYALAGGDPGDGPGGAAGRTDAVAVRPDPVRSAGGAGLAVGETLEEIASAGGVAISTVRSQLRRVLEKTGCARQAEVVSLLANVTLDRGAARTRPLRPVLGRRHIS